jgi:hypothetical protein
MKLNSRFPARNICNEIATMIFYQQVTEGQLIKKEPINEEVLRENLGSATTSLNPEAKKFIHTAAGFMQNKTRD